MVLSEKGASIGVLCSVVDITNRKLAKESLARAEHEKETILDSLLEIVVYMDLEMRILWANIAACKSVDLTRDELIGRHCFELWADISEPCSDCVVVRAIKTGQAQEIEKTTPDGKSWFNIGCPVRDEKNTIIGGIEVVLEITERKKAEEALRDSKVFISSLLTNSPHPILVINPDTSVRYVSPALETLTGFSSEEIIDRKAPYPWWTEEIMQKTGDDLEEAMRKGAKKLEKLFQKKNGERFRVEITSVPITENGAFKYYLASWVDITDRKQAEEALRESEHKYSALVQESPDAIISLGKTGNLLSFNPAAERISGLLAEEVIGKHFARIGVLAKQSIPKALKEFAFVVTGTKRPPFELTIMNKDKSYFFMEANPRLIKHKGDKAWIQVTFRDITDRKLAGLALIERGKELENKAQELEEVNAALRVLLKHRDEDKKDFEEKIVANVKKLVLPYVEKLNNSQLNDRQMVYLNIIKSNLEDIITPFLHQLSSKYSDLTPSEIQVAGFVKEGKTTKEIAELLNSSTGAINFHRNNLRKKLGLRNTKTNLRSFLLPLS
jgi:PAS domain S-box-containing protein